MSIIHRVKNRKIEKRLSAARANRTVVWLQSSRQKDVNSASELGAETLRETSYKIERFSRFPIHTALRVYLASRRGALVYYQFGTPLENFVVCFLVAAKRTVVVHYLDKIAEGYPFWAKMMGLNQSIYYLLRNARLVVAISPEMKREIQNKIFRKGLAVVGFRAIPDSGPAHGEVPARYKNSVIFAGNINRKTNFDALLHAVFKLREENMKLIVYTRTTESSLLDKLREAGAEIRGELEASEVVQHSFEFRAQLLPFNSDNMSKDFYFTSTPSKLPNVLMARRPVIYFGPSDYWVRNWLKRQCGLMLDLEDDFSAKISVKPLSREAALGNLKRFSGMNDTILWEDM